MTTGESDAHEESRAPGTRPSRLGSGRRGPPGAPPGSLAVAPDARPARLTLRAYGPDGVVTREDAALTDLDAVAGVHPVLWIDVDGFGDGEAIARLGARFGLHRLALEDVVTPHQRPKVEDYGAYLFIVTRMPRPGGLADTDQLALFLLEGLVITFHEHATAAFEPLCRRIDNAGSGLRTSAADYLAYAVLDAVVDGYFPVLEDLGEHLEALEERVAEAADEDCITAIHSVKHELLALRRAVWPQRELVSTLARGDLRLIAPTTRVFLRDCYDNVIQLMDVIETGREIASGLIDVYMSGLSNRMNEVMKVLTVIATVFIPMSFVAGLYGMNFDRSSPWNMPELGWRFGYPFALGVMAAIAGGLLLYFRRKGWIGRRRR